MIRTILVPTSGSETDAAVFETALAAARPCQAHLEFFHVRVSEGEALRYSEHASFARGEALRSAIQELKDESKKRCIHEEYAYKDQIQTKWWQLSAYY